MKKQIIIFCLMLLVLTACSTARQKLSPQGNVNLKTADVYYSQQDVEQAEIYYLKVLEDNPDHAIALRRLGDISLFKAENFSAREVEFYEDAYHYYTKAISVTEQFPNLTDQDRIDLRDMKKRKERAWTRIFLAAGKEKEAGNTQRAMEIYELAHKLEPERPEPMIQLKNIYLVELKDDVKAEQILQQLLQKDPDKLEYLMEMGTFYYNKGNYAEAVKYFEKARPQIPTNI
ncbi:MAG: tetratricopeptide repeat protein, partial [Candidatus Cloacimonas acidaminovorans]|nr:tetratricopeptide repeat protein [Candidatus Cloacimonas acidaminovorans]